jgi:hypothetical protein
MVFWGRNMTDGAWDFEVRRIDLGGLNVDAGRNMGLVIVQPEYELVPDGAVPFRLARECRETQTALIKQAFEIRAAEAQQRNVPVPFVLFPEGAIPVGDPDALGFVRQQIEDAQGDLIFIGGLEGLSIIPPGGCCSRGTEGSLRRALSGEVPA